MSLQHQRIAELCEQFKLAGLGAQWPALAQDPMDAECSPQQLPPTWHSRQPKGSSPISEPFLQDMHSCCAISMVDRDLGTA